MKSQAMSRRPRFVSSGLCVLLLAVPAVAGDYEFKISFPPSLRSEPYSGRVYLFFSKNSQAEARLGPNWFQPEPMVAVDVENWKPDEPLPIGTTSSKAL